MSWLALGRRGRTRAGRRGSAAPSARTDGCRAGPDARRWPHRRGRCPRSRARPSAALRSRMPPRRCVAGGADRGRRLVILVDQRLELGELAPALGPGQRRGQMIDDHRGGAPLGLGALAGIVDDERVEVRQRPQHRLGQAVGRQGGGLARQPLQVAVLAEMDDRMRAEVVRAARDRRRGSRAAGRGPARGRSRRDRCGSRGRAAGRPRRCPAAGPTARNAPPARCGSRSGRPSAPVTRRRTSAGRPANSSR